MASVNSCLFQEKPLAMMGIAVSQGSLMLQLAVPSAPSLLQYRLWQMFHEVQQFLLVSVVPFPCDGTSNGFSFLGASLPPLILTHNVLF